MQPIVSVNPTVRKEPQIRIIQWSLAVLALILLPTLAIGQAATPVVQQEPGTDLAAELALVLEPPVANPCVSTGCINIEVFGSNPDTGECRLFPNPCSVPPGWQLGCP